MPRKKKPDGPPKPGELAPKKMDYSHLEPSKRHARRGLNHRRIMYEVYRLISMEGKPRKAVAQELGYSEVTIGRLYQQAMKALSSADNFDPQAVDMRKEMKKFLPLAAESLKVNLMEAEPRVTVAYLQGIGALVDRTEVEDVTDRERQEQMNRAYGAMNPRLRKGIGITDADIRILPDSEVKIETVERGPESDNASHPDRGPEQQPAAASQSTPPLPEPESRPEREPTETLAEQRGAGARAEETPGTEE